jgi:hypothetical protein
MGFARQRIGQGDIAIDDEFHSIYVLGATLDYNSGPLRASLNLNYQRLNRPTGAARSGRLGSPPRFSRSAQGIVITRMNAASQ